MTGKKWQSRRHDLHCELYTRADRSLEKLKHYLEKRFSKVGAEQYGAAVVQFCLDLRMFPERGSVQPQLGPDVRRIGFRNEVTILFRINRQRGTVVILDLSYRGRQVHL